MPKTDFWMCDTCGQVIQNLKDGWVEWIIVRAGKDRSGRGLRIVHHMPASPRQKAGGCQYDSSAEYARDRGTLSDLGLDDFVGANGLMRLLQMITYDGLPAEEVVEVIKRIHIPGYERARFHAAGAEAAGDFEPNMPEGFYTQRQIDRILDWAQSNGRTP